MDEYRSLAEAILLQAYKDLPKYIKNIHKYEAEVKEYIETLNPKYEESHELLRLAKGKLKKLELFFNSKWCEDLCDFTEIDINSVREKIKTEKERKKSLNIAI